MTVIFEVRGGIGKVIASTAILKTIRERHPDDDIVVVSPYPTVFNNNPYLDYNYYNNDMDAIYYVHIEGKKVKYYVQDPYFTDGFMNREMDLISSWHQLYDAYHIQKSQPQLYLADYEIESAKALYKTDKPIFVLHTHGGNDTYSYNWAKDLPDCVIKEIIDKYKDDYTIYHIKESKQPTYEHTKAATEDIRMIAGLIHMSKKRLFIDSFAQHMAKALYKRSTVCWIATSPKNFGYDFHNNILCNAYDFKTTANHYQQYGLREDRNNLPFAGEERIFDVDEIITSINLQ